MGYETPDHRKVVNEIVFTDQAGTPFLGISGRVLLSGNALLLDIGSNWETIDTS